MSPVLVFTATVSDSTATAIPEVPTVNDRWIIPIDVPPSRLEAADQNRPSERRLPAPASG
jgi:hypothetical protein